MHNGENMLILTQRFWFSRLRPVGGAKTLPPSVPPRGPWGEGGEVISKIQKNMNLDEITI